MRAAQLRELLRLERRGKFPDGAGGFDEGWGEVADNIPAKVFHKTGSEQVLAERLKGVTVLEIHVRSNEMISTMTTDDRLVDARTGALYNIKTVLPDTRNRILMITATLGTLQ